MRIHLPVRTDAIAPLIAAALWGGMYVVSKWGFASIPPLTLSFLRVALAVPVLLVVVSLTRPDRSFDRGDYRAFAVLGGWVAVTLASQFVGTDLTTAGQGALLTVLTPVFTLVLGVAVLGESLTRRKTGGMALAAIGTLVVVVGRYDPTALATNGGAGTAGRALGGVALLIVASFGWAAYTVYGKPLVREYSALETATYSTLVSVPLLAVCVPPELAYLGLAPTDLPVTPAVVGAVLYLAIGSTAAAWYLWYRGLETLDAGSVAVFFFAQPVVGAALGAIVLDESLGAPFVLGGGIMAVGIYAVSTGR